MCWRRCLCWHDLKSASIAIAVFAIVTSLLQILVQVGVFTAGVDPKVSSTISADSVPGIISRLFIALAAMDAVTVLISLIFLCGIEQSSKFRSVAILWLVWIAIYIIYESAVVIFYFVQEFADKSTKILTDSLGPLIVMICYWSVKEIILFIGWLGVISWLCYDYIIDSSDSRDHTLELIPAAKTSSHCHLAGTDINGIYYNGGSTVTQVQVHDPPHTSCLRPSHFEVVRPSQTSCCVNSPNPNFGRAGLYGGLYGPPRYIYAPN